MFLSKFDKYFKGILEVKRWNIKKLKKVKTWTLYYCFKIKQTENKSNEQKPRMLFRTPIIGVIIISS